MTAIRWQATLLVTLCALCCAPLQIEAADAISPRVVLISVDGLAGFYLDDARADLPTIRRLAESGASSGSMRCSFPTVTWPNHTTLVTGVPPAVHGVLGNDVVDRTTGNVVQLIGDPTYDKHEIVQAPTIYDAAKNKGLLTAAVAWPATRNANTLDWTIPEVSSQELFERYTTRGWLDQLREAGVPVDSYDAWAGYDGVARLDWLCTQAAIHAIETYRPNLLLLHLLVVDSTQHRHGPQSAEAYWALRYADDRVRDVVEAVQRAGLADDTTFIVVSDHGFFPIEKVILPNVAFKKAGLLEADGDAITRKDAYAQSQGGAAEVYVLDRSKRDEIIPRVVELCGKLEGVEAVIEPEGFAALGQPKPDYHRWAPDLWLAAKNGYVFWHGVEGEEEIITEPPRGMPRYKGMHGYSPDHANMRGVLIASGRGISNQRDLGEVSNLDVAPTIARLLGLDFPSAEGKPIRAAE